MFTRWGYREVRTPTFEFLETISTGIGSELSDKMFKFQDQDGNIVALRAELTTPIARLAATKLVDAIEPIRLFYVANVFRYATARFENLREFWQAGVESIGSAKPEADAEVIALLIEALSAVGLKDVRLFLNHSQILRKLLQNNLVREDRVSRIRELIGSRDSRQLATFLEESDVESEASRTISGLLKCSTPDDAHRIEPALKQLGCREEIANLLQVITVLKDYGVEKNIFLDFSLTRSIEYYTGLMFEAAVPSLGKPVAGGGRYDTLLEKFGGARSPATGFAIEIDKCIEALEVQGNPPTADGPRLLVLGKGRLTVRALNLIRKNGIPAISYWGMIGPEKALDYARLQGCTHVIFPDRRGTKVTTIDAVSRRKLRGDLTVILKKIRVVRPR